MKKNLVALTSAVVMVGVLQICACGLIEPETIPISLGSSGVFVLQTGVPNENIITLTNHRPAGFSVVSGSMKIDQSAITVIPDLGAPAKGNVNFQARQFDIVIKLANTETGEAVCQEGTQHGPFSVVLDDEDFVAVSITPPNVELSDEAIALFNERSSVMCITVTAGFSGRVVIDEIVLTVTIGF